MPIKLRKTLVVTFMKHLPFFMSMAINALATKIITRHLLIIMNLTIIAQTQVAKARIIIMTQVAEIQVATAQMEGPANPSNLANRAPGEVGHPHRLFSPSLVAIHLLVASHTKPIYIGLAQDSP